MLSITASGLVTPVGFTSAASCAAMRAGIRQVEEANLWDPETGSYIGAGKVHLPHWWIGLGKLAELAAPAIIECIDAAVSTSPEEIPLLLGVAESRRPGRFAGLDEQILDEVEHRLGFRLNPASRVIPRGQVSVIVGLREAESLLMRGEARCCVVAAVDSLLQRETVRPYLEQRRILTPANSNGFAPGEAGSAVLVRSQTAGEESSLAVLGIGTAREVATPDSDEPRRGDGLTQAIRGALAQAQLSIQDVQYRIADLSGEHDWFKEMAFAMLRHERALRPKLFELWHPSENIGETGAAIGPMLFAVALAAGRKGYAVGPTALLTFGNDEGDRAAAVVRFEPGRR